MAKKPVLLCIMDGFGWVPNETFGNAVVAATEVEEIVRAEWRDLGMPETLWNCRVKEFGPLIVSIDTHGNNLIAENKKLFAERRDPIVEEICEHVHYIK